MVLLRVKPLSALRRFLHGQASSGLVLMAAAALAMIIANSSLGPNYEHLLHGYVGPLSLHHWINDGLMAIFFLLVGLEIKREVMDGQLSTWPRRVLPGIAAAGGMAIPALIYLAFNNGATARGWAIPAATDIAFAIPLQGTPGRPDAEEDSPLHRLEHLLHLPVGFVIVPIFGLANAGVPVMGLQAEAFTAPVTIGVGLGLLLGKVVGVFGTSMIAIKLGLADMPAHAGRLQMLGTALLCGIGFTMSLFITLLAFSGDPLLQSEAKIGILAGSLLSGLLGYLLLRIAKGDTKKQ